jgi:hypothetical protein
VADALTHRALAAATFNECWELLEADRSPAQDLELLELAFTSRHHWRAEGAPQQVAIADWMVARCFSALDEGKLALRFANAALDAAPDGAPAWLRASLLEGLARAHAANGDQAGRDGAVKRAATILAEETDAEDRGLIADQLASVPPARKA